MRVSRFSLALVILVGISFIAASCGGGSEAGVSSDGVVLGVLRVTNNCSTSQDISIGDSDWGTITPGQSVEHEVLPGNYTVMACTTGTTSCAANYASVSSRTDFTMYTCGLP